MSATTAPSCPRWLNKRGTRMLSRSLGASAPPRHSLLHGGIHSTVEWNRAAYRHLGVTRFEHHRDPGRVRRGGCERGLILGFGLWRGLMLDRLPVLGQPAPHALDQLPRIPLTLFRRHLIKPVLEGSADVDLCRSFHRSGCRRDSHSLAAPTSGGRCS